VLGRLPDLIPGSGKILLVTTPGFTRRGLTDKIAGFVGKSRLLVFDQVTPNPELDSLDQATLTFKSCNIAAIVALGGGSALDTGKVLGVALPCDLDNPLDKIFRQGIEYTWDKGIPVIAIPTTSGTGAEVTPFATVWDQTTHKKHSVEGDQVYPEIALLDPELTLTLPYQVTLYTGLDAVSHALESLWNKNKTVVSQAFALQALAIANKALPLVLETPDDVILRRDMQNTAMLAGMAISQTKTAIAHSISYPLTSHYGVPHGLACSFTLPSLIEYYLNFNTIKYENVILNSTLENISNLNLMTEIFRYISKVEIESHIDEMFNPQRAENFFKVINNDKIIDLLNFL
jgi:alcohol dehydrogenase